MLNKPGPYQLSYLLSPNSEYLYIAFVCEYLMSLTLELYQALVLEEFSPHPTLLVKDFYLFACLFVDGASHKSGWP